MNSSLYADLLRRIEEMEIHNAFQDGVIQTLSDAVARQQDTLDEQQIQLRLLYQKMPDKDLNDYMNFSSEEGRPPHY